MREKRLLRESLLKTLYRLDKISSALDSLAIYYSMIRWWCGGGDGVDPCFLLLLDDYYYIIIN